LSRTPSMETRSLRRVPLGAAQSGTNASKQMEDRKVIESEGEQPQQDSV
jgi:hypothetical protein